MMRERPWRSPGVLMTVYLILFVIAGPWSYLSQSGQESMAAEGRNAPSILIAAFLAWRVARGGRISRGIILAYTIGGAAASMNGPAARSVPVLLGLLAVYALQVGILLSTPVFNRTRRDPATMRPEPAPFWEIPPRWMPLAAAFGGIVITLLSLGNMSEQRVPGCQDGSLGPRAPAVQCWTMNEGFPAHFLSTAPSVSLDPGTRAAPATLDVSDNPSVHDRAAAEDLTIWVAVSFLGCYMLWLPSGRPIRPTRQPWEEPGPRDTAGLVEDPQPVE